VKPRPAAAADDEEGRPLRDLPTPLQPGQSRRVVLEEMTAAFVEGKGHVQMARYCDTGAGDSSTKDRNFWLPRVEFGAGTTPRVVDAVVLQSAVDAHRLFKRHVEKPPFYEETFIGKGVLSVGEAKPWAAQRAVLKPAFGIKALGRLLPLVWAGTAELCDGPLAAAAARREPVEVHEALSHLAFVLIGHAALGESDSGWLAGRAAEMRAAFDAGLVPGHREDDPGTVAVLHEFSDRVFRRVRQARGGGGAAAAAVAAGGTATYREHSVVAQLLEHHETKEESAAAAAAAAGGGGACPAQCHDELMTFQFAGHETTANTMTWALYEICRHPEVQAKLHAEIDAVLPALRAEALASGAMAAAGVARGAAGGDDTLSWLTYKQLFKFRYLTRVINETLRLWPVVANGPFRKLQEDDTVSCPHGGSEPVRLPKGTIVQVPHWSMHRAVSVWGADAAEFRPERAWKQKSFMPFTLPPRDCLGRNFAMMEMRAVLLALLCRFKMELAGPPAGAEGSTREQRTGHNQVTLRPENGMLVLMSRRECA
jgi:cytochrome P450